MRQGAWPCSISLVAADSLVSGAQCAFAIDVDGDGDVDVLSAAYDDDTIAWHLYCGSSARCLCGRC